MPLHTSTNIDSPHKHHLLGHITGHSKGHYGFYLWTVITTLKTVELSLNIFGLLCCCPHFPGTTPHPISVYACVCVNLCVYACVFIYVDVFMLFGLLLHCPFKMLIRSYDQYLSFLLYPLPRSLHLTLSPSPHLSLLPSLPHYPTL